MTCVSRIGYVTLLLALLLSATVLTQQPTPAPEPAAQTPAPETQPSEPQAESGVGEGQAQSGLRTPRLSDQHDGEEIVGSPGFSPDGTIMMISRRRPANSQVTNSIFLPSTRDDIWIQDAPGKPLRNLTNGAEGDSGWWFPKWSPDSQRLAFVSSRGGHVTPWVWERKTNQLRQVSKRGVMVDGLGGENFRWIDNDRFLIVAARERELSSPRGDEDDLRPGRATERARANWEKAERGEVTASAIDSLEFTPMERRLFLVDVARGTDTEIGPMTTDFYRGTSWWISPTNTAVAFVRPAPSKYSLVHSAIIDYPVALDVRRLDGKPVPLKRELPTNILAMTVEWSPNGKELAFFALGDAVIHGELLFGSVLGEIDYPEVKSRDYPGRLWRVNVETGDVVQWDTSRLDLGKREGPPMLGGTHRFGHGAQGDPWEKYYWWTAAGELIFPVFKPDLEPRANPADGWVVLSRDGRTRPLVKKLIPKKYPENIHPIGNASLFIGMTDDDLWRIDPTNGTMENLTAEVDDPVFMVRVFNDKSKQPYLWVQTAKPKSDGERIMFKESHRGVPAEHAEYMIYPNSDDFLSPVKPPMPDNGLWWDEGMQDFSTETKMFSYKLRWTKEGSDMVWRVAPDGTSERVLEINQHQKQLGRFKAFEYEYTGMNGEPLKALVTLPLNYQKGRRYPVVVDSDVDYTPLTNPYRYDEIVAMSHGGVVDGDAATFAAAGYVYIWASMPIAHQSDNPEYGSRRYYRYDLPFYAGGLVTALQKAVDLGFGDPERAFLYGWSSMGHGVYGVVTQTDRFTAAAGGAGFTDKPRHDMTTTLRERMSENPFRYAFNWGGNRYLDREVVRRNLPVNYVDRVRTPLMMIHGDLDLIPMEDVEEFFEGLVRRRRPAQFVRYWGEGHGIQNPRNHADMFQRMFAWFDKWGDITRDSNGDFVFEGDRAKSRGKAPALTPEDYAKFDVFRPSALEQAPVEGVKPTSEKGQ